MDYSKLSDAEIASKVLIAQGYKLIDDGYGYSIYISDSGRKDIGPKSSRQFVFDPCNNPADAWPIILKNCISLVWDCAEDGSSDWWNSFDKFDDCRVQHQSNPLRAAMIVFLMMQESE